MANARFPHSVTAERYVLGAVLLFGRSALARAGALLAEDFYVPAHQAIWAAIQEADRSLAPIDPLSVAAQMHREQTVGRLRAVGGEAFLAELVSEAATQEGVDHHARTIEGAASLRRLILGLAPALEHARLEGVEPTEVIEEAQRAVFDCTRTSRSSRRSLMDATAGATDALELLGRRGSAGLSGVSTGFWELDQMTGGWQRKELAILAARPSMGKTALLLNALEAAAHAGAPSLLFSLEMSADQIALRALSTASEIEMRAMRGGLRGHTLATAREALQRLRLPIDIVDWSAPTLAEIRAEARRWRMEWIERTRQAGEADPGGVIAIDYLQLIGGTGAPRHRRQEWSREREIGDISRGLKALAKELDVSVICLSQLNRGVEQRPDKRPRNSDLRDSGQVEQDADLIGFLYRDEVYKKESKDKGYAELIIGKQRNGPTGTVRLKFRPSCVRFEDAVEAPRYQQEPLL